jgi:DNA-binding NarL/FixJ family response regulator
LRTRSAAAARRVRSAAGSARAVALARSLSAEVHARRLAEATLAAVLEAAAYSVFRVALDGTVTPLSDEARAALAGDPDGLPPRLVHACRDAADDTTLVTRCLDATGALGHLVLRRNHESAFERRLHRAARRWRLTPRHADVAGLLARGFSNKQIAAQLSCALHTVELHVTEVLKRSGLPSRGALIAAFWSDA